MTNMSHMLKAGALVAIALVVVAACSGGDEEATSPTTSTTSSRPSVPVAQTNEFEAALDDLGVDLDAAPAAVTKLASLEFCGFEQSQGLGGPRSQFNESARRCFLDRYETSRPAVFVMSQTTIEGDPVVTIYRSTRKGDVELFVDATRDAFGSGKWESGTCEGVTTDFPGAPQPTPSFHFDVENCAPIGPAAS